MSTEAIEKIRDIENQAKKMVLLAQAESDRSIKALKIKIAEEKKELSQKLTRERNQRIMRQTIKDKEELQSAEIEAKALGERMREEYKKLSECAISAAMELLLGG